MPGPTLPHRVNADAVEVLCLDLQCLHRPADRLLWYVEDRLEQLAKLGVLDPWASNGAHEEED